MLDALLGATPWLVVLLCLAAEAFFAAAELAILSADRLRLEEQARLGSAAATRVLWFRDHPERLYGTTLLGATFSTVTGTAAAALTLLALDPAHGGFWAGALMTPLVLIGGELVPKSIAQARADALAASLAGPLYRVHRALAPLIRLIEAYTGGLYRVLGLDEDSRRTAMVSREELALLMQSQAAEGELNAGERLMITRIFQFSQKRARETMVPLVEMVAIDDTATVEEAAALIAREGYSRLPVYHDRVYDVVGILHHLDLLKAASKDQKVSDLMRPAYFVPESQEIDDILIILQREAASAAIVVDEFGGTVGLITLEDILEEVVGDIGDEFDEAGGHWRPAPDGGYVVNGRLPVEKLNEAFGLSLPLRSDDYETVAGYVLYRLGRIPRTGEALRLKGGARMTVVRATERAVQEIHLAGVQQPRGA